MDQLPILDQSSTIIKKLNHLLSSLPSDQEKGLSINFRTSIKRVSELYSPIEPEQVLHQLLDKTSAAVARKNWKHEETSYLIYIIDKYCLGHQIDPENLSPLDWENISEFLPGRSQRCCQFRFLSLAPSSITDTPWLSQQRQLLIRIIQSQQAININWKVVSEKLYQLNPSRLYRTGKQCREHYTCFLKPNLKKGPWTESEDYQLICLFLSFGKKWSKMAKFIEGRNQNSIKNRFFLMFQNRKEGRLTNSDLSKIVKRKKEKIEKRIFKNQTEESSEENLTLTANEDAVKIEEQMVKVEEIGENLEEIAPTFLQMECLFQNQHNKYWDFNKNQTFFDNSSEQIEKYICF